MLIAPRLNGSEGFWSPEWRKCQRRAAYKWSCSMLKGGQQRVHFFLHLILLLRPLHWRCGGCYGVPGHEVGVLQHAPLGTEPAAESHWENPARAAVITFLLGSMSCKKSASHMLCDSDCCCLLLLFRYTVKGLGFLFICLFDLFLIIPVDYGSDYFKKLCCIQEWMWCDWSGGTFALC